ncbi:MAG: RHS repeat protein [Flavobacterium sp. JAD_PAG50586_2]|nr:MAG: RHS repeat protein [Flavobacterium sp. JAD_PAG50586_2]
MDGFNSFIKCVYFIQGKTRNPVTVKAEYGGGIRVKNIYYTTDDTPEISTQEFPDSYSKKISYDYNFFDVPGRSSGSLVYPKPKLQYYDAKRIDKVAIGTVSHIFDFDKIYYSIFSTSNNLSFISTKGSDVGYKNVTVSETGNGRTQYTYLSPIDHPEYMHSANVTFPFAGTPNIDYKRGHLTLEEKYDETGRILNQTTSVYDFEDYEKRTGINVYTFPTIGDICYDCPYAGHYLYYHYYRLGYLDPTTYCCVPNPSTGEPIIVGQLLNFNVRTCGSNVSDFVTYYLQKEAFGWAKLKNTLTKEYFYDTGNVQTSVENNIAYTYNPNNMQLATQTSQTSTVGVEIEKKIYYTIDNETDLEPNITALRNNNMVETPLKIETFKNGVKLAEQKTIYKDWGNDLLAPEIVQSSKGTLPLENRIRYNLMDTATGNPLEVQQENGTVISYIWGYNKSQPIAKIENATNAQIATAIGMSLTTVNETNIPANLRATLPNAMVTTYTYIPLVGISTITDPKGYTTTYEYDSFGRLKTVKDADGNKLSENTYHYRPQN